MSDFEEMELELVAATVICHTPGCENEGIPIEMMCAGVVACGPCGQLITDIDPPLPDEPYDQLPEEGP